MIKMLYCVRKRLYKEEAGTSFVRVRCVRKAIQLKIE